MAEEERTTKQSEPADGGDRGPFEVVVTDWCAWEELDPDRSTASFLFYGYRETKGFVTLASSGARHGFRLLELARESEGDHEVEELEFTEAPDPASVGMAPWDFQRALARRAELARTVRNMVPPPHARFRAIHVRMGSPLAGEDLAAVGAVIGAAGLAHGNRGIRSIEGPDAEGVFRLVPDEALVACIAPRPTHFYLAVNEANGDDVLVQLIVCNVATEADAEAACNERNRERAFGLRCACSPRAIHLTGALWATRDAVASTFTRLWNEAIARIAPDFPGVGGVNEDDRWIIESSGNAPGQRQHASLSRLLLSNDEASAWQAFELLASLGDDAPWERLASGFVDEDQGTNYCIVRGHDRNASAPAGAPPCYRLERRSLCEESREAFFAANLDNLWTRAPIRSFVDDLEGATIMCHVIDVVVSNASFVPRLTRAWLALRAFEPQSVEDIELDW